MDVVIQNQLLRDQQRMKAQADKGRVERQSSISDLVYLKLQPYDQMTIACHSNQNLSFKYFGPFKILQRVAIVAQKLQLPERSKIHAVVQVFVLKKVVPLATEVCSDLPYICSDPKQVMQPEAILDWQAINHSEVTIAHVLVKWKGLSDDQVTWEDLEDMQE